MSGHSKWSQIKHKKAITDAKKGKIFSRLTREVMIASKTGGTNPDSNVHLRAAIERARAQGVPKDNIERAITRGSGSAQDQHFKEFLYEATGPGGLTMLIEGITDNTNRSVSEIKHMLTTHQGRMAKPGSLLWNFKKIGILEVLKKQGSGKNENETELALIECGAIDFYSMDDRWIIETEFIDREHIRECLIRQHISVCAASHDYQPGTPITLDPPMDHVVNALLDALTDHDDVQDVYTNIHHNEIL